MEDKQAKVKFRCNRVCLCVCLELSSAPDFHVVCFLQDE